MIQLDLLGGIGLLDGDGRPIDEVLSQPKSFGLLVLIAASGNGTPNRDQIAAILWPDSDRVHGRRNLRTRIHSLRRALGEHVLPKNREEHVFVDSAALSCDVAAFDRAIESGELEHALRLYAGDFLGSFYLDDGSEFDRWADGRRQSLRAAAGSAAVTLRDQAAAAGDLPSAVTFARRACDIFRLDEGHLQVLIRLLDRSGDRAGALAAYEAFADALARDLEVEPSPETVALVQSVRARADTNGVAADVPTNSAPRAPAAQPPGVGTPVHRVVTGTLATAAAVGFLALGVSQMSPKPDSSSAVKKLAILTFEALGPESDSGLFAAGMREELVTRLAGLRGVSVITGARVDRMYSEAEGADLDQALGVDAVLRGSLRRQENRIRVTAELVDANSGETLWADITNGSLDDVFAAQADMALAIASSLRVTLAPEERVRLNKPPAPPEAWLHFQTARRFLNTARNEAEWDQGFQFARRALALDSTFAPGWGVLAILTLWRPRDGGLVQARDSAKQFIERALALDSNNARVQAHAGIVRARTGDDIGALTAYLKVVELRGACYAAACYNLAEWYRAHGRLDQTAVWLELRVGGPFNREMIVGPRAVMDWKLGNYERAGERFAALRQISPDKQLELHAEFELTLGRVEEARALVRRGVAANRRLLPAAGLVELFAEDHDAAKRLFLEALSLDPPLRENVPQMISTSTALGYVYWKTGDNETARKYFAESQVANRGLLDTEAEPFRLSFASYDMARIYAIQGQLETAKQWLRRAIDQHHWHYVYIHLGPKDPMLENLHGDPEFVTMMAGVRAEVDRQRRRFAQLETLPFDELFARAIAEAWADVEELSSHR